MDLREMLSKISPRAVVIGLAIFTISAGVTGCSLGDVIRTKTPVEVQKSEKLPERMTLNESQAERDRYIYNVEQNITQWNENIEEGLALQALLSDIVMTELSPERLALMGIPVGGPAALLLSFGIGAFLKRPGDANPKEQQKQKEDSYNAGLKKAKEL